MIAKTFAFGFSGLLFFGSLLCHFAGASTPACSSALDTNQEAGCKATALLQIRGVQSRVYSAGSSQEGSQGERTGINLVYGVFTSPREKYAEQLEAVMDTWAKDVPLHSTLLVVGVNGSSPGVVYKEAPLCKDGHATNPGISCKEATLLATGYELGADWVLVLGSDNYVFVSNFEERLSREDASTPQVLGIHGCGNKKFCEDHKDGLCGGGGYAISRGALDKMIGKGEDAGHAFVLESMHTAETVGGYWSDQVTSCLARRSGVKEVQLRGLYGWKLCGQPAIPGECSFNQAPYKRLIEASTQATPVLTFHYLAPDDMHTIHEMAKEAETRTDGYLLEISAGAAAAEDLHTTSYDEHRAAYIQMQDMERTKTVLKSIDDAYEAHRGA